MPTIRPPAADSPPPVHTQQPIGPDGRIVGQSAELPRFPDEVPNGFAAHFDPNAGLAAARVGRTPDIPFVPSTTEAERLDEL